TAPATSPPASTVGTPSGPRCPGYTPAGTERSSRSNALVTTTPDESRTPNAGNDATASASTTPPGPASITTLATGSSAVRYSWAAASSPITTAMTCSRPPGNCPAYSTNRGRRSVHAEHCGVKAPTRVSPERVSRETVSPVVATASKGLVV